MKRVILESIELWQRAACPVPGPKHLDVGLGVHVEEFEEMLSAIKLDDAHEYLRRDACEILKHLSKALKQGQAQIDTMDRKEVLDGLADQIVTAIGFGYRAGMKVPEAVLRVDKSNWTKYDREGRPSFDEHGKVLKGPDYVPADLEGCY